MNANEWPLETSNPLEDLKQITDDMLSNTGLKPISRLAPDIIKAETLEQVMEISYQNGWLVQYIPWRNYRMAWGITSDKEVKIYYFWESPDA